MNEQTEPSHILASLPEFQMLMAVHLNSVQSLAARHGLTIQTIGFAITFVEDGQNTSAYHGCSCLTCAAKTHDLMGKGIAHALSVVNPSGVDSHDQTGQVH